MGYLYKLDFSSNKSYIGITNQKTIRGRINGHRFCAKNNPKYPINHAWGEYGEPKVKILAIAEGKFLLELERKAIIAYKTLIPGGYNSDLGDSLNKRPCRTRISREYRSWLHMKSRCNNPNHERYYNYGGRGINVCKEWNESFEKFLEDMGSSPLNTSLDRVDNNKGYSPENCRWATKVEQNNNTRTNRILEYKGRKQTVTQWERELNFGRGTIANRLIDGWTIEKCLSTPIDKRFTNTGKRAVKV